MNIGPLDCEPGTEIEVIRVVSQFGICLHQELWEDDYASRLSGMTGRRFPESLSSQKHHPLSRSQIKSLRKGIISLRQNERHSRQPKQI